MLPFNAVVISFLAVQVLAQDTYTSANTPDFYAGEQGTVTCVFETEAPEELGGFGISDQNRKELGVCYIARQPGKVVVLTAEGEGITVDACTTAYNDMLEGSASVEISLTLRKPGDYKCYSYTTAEYFDHESVISVTELKVAPKSLTASSPSEVYSGDYVTFTCQSEGGSPAASFIYAKDGEPVEGEVEPFRATRADDGTTFSCSDSSHAYYMGGQSAVTYLEQTLKVYYFESTRPDVVTMHVNPTVTHTLSCSTESNKQNMNISYVWTKDEEEVSGENAIDLVASQDSALNKTLNETYACTATPDDAKFEAVTITFVITWDVETSTPTEPPTTTSELTTKPSRNEEDENKKEEIKDPAPEGPTMIIIIVVVVVTVIILIVVIVIIVIKRRSANSATLNKEGAQQPVKQGDAEQGNGEEVRAKEEETKLLKNQENNKSE